MATVLTIKLISDAMQGNAFWLDASSDAAQVVTEATRRGYIRRLSHTQAQWAEEGLAKARAELRSAPSCSPLLSERILARLSPLRRANLERRIREHLEDLQGRLPYCENVEVAPGLTELALYAEYARALERMLGHLAALTA